MGNLKYTPGPWAWQKFGNYRNLVAQHGIREIIIGSLAEEMPTASYPTMNSDGILRPIEPDFPNAKLIAAAPDLLQALENLVETAKGFEMLPVKWIDPLQAAEDAIKKAIL